MGVRNFALAEFRGKMREKPCACARFFTKIANFRDFREIAKPRFFRGSSCEKSRVFAKNHEKFAISHEKNLAKNRPIFAREATNFS